MKNKLIRGILVIVACSSFYVSAEQAWISDNLRTGIQDGPERNSGFVGTIVAGSPVERLEESEDGQYIRIRNGDLEGWVLARNVSDQPSIRARFDEQAVMLAEVRRQLNALQHTDADASEQNQKLRDELVAAKADAQKARDELLSLRRASENVVEIDTLNHELQDKVVSLEQANLRLTQQNTRLTEQSQHRQMMLGGALVLGGMLLFWLLSLMGGARRRSTFHDF